MDLQNPYPASGGDEANCNTENEPLLASAEPVNLVRCGSTTACNLWSCISNSPKTRTYATLYLLHTANHFATYIVALPQVSLYERIICGEHYGFPDVVKEDSCKLPVIQDKVAYLLGLTSALQSIPGELQASKIRQSFFPSLPTGIALLTSLWYGSLADKWGRRPILGLACTGELLSMLWTSLFG